MLGNTGYDILKDVALRYFGKHSLRFFFLLVFERCLEPLLNAFPSVLHNGFPFGCKQRAFTGNSQGGLIIDVFSLVAQIRRVATRRRIFCSDSGSSAMSSVST